MTHRYRFPNRACNGRMVDAYRTIFVAPARRDGPEFLIAGLAIGGFLLTLAAYATGLAAVSGGVVWIPSHAALVGLVAALVVGSLRGGLLSAWLVAAAPLLAFRADWAFFGLSSRTRPEQVAYFLDVEGLAVLGLLAIVLGTLAFALGWAGRRLVATLSAP